MSTMRGMAVERFGGVHELREIDETYPLERAGEAQSRLAAGGVRAS